MRNFEKIFDFDLLKISKEELQNAIAKLRATRLDEIAAHNAARRKITGAKKTPKAPGEKSPRAKKTNQAEDLMALCKELNIEVTPEMLEKLKKKAVGRPKKQKPDAKI